MKKIHRLCLILTGLSILSLQYQIIRVEKLIETHEHDGKSVKVCNFLESDDCGNTIAVFNEKREIIGFKPASK